MAFTGTGALQGQRISVPESSAAPEPGDTTGLPPQVQHALQQSEGELNGQMNAQLQPLADLSPLYIPAPQSLATNPQVIALLQAHAQAAGTCLSHPEIVAYVALGERVVRAIEASVAEDAQTATPTPTRPQVDGMELTPNLEAMRAIAWYVVACAAQQDVNQQAMGTTRKVGEQEITDLTISGSYLLKDPHNALYHFMSSGPLAYSRISTHFNELSEGSPGYLGHADQRGIEDYARRLPGENGTILFDRLKDGENKLIFFKFEYAGVPTLLSGQKVDDRGQGGGSYFEVLQRVWSHATSFISTSLVTTPGVERKEHVYKGLLESAVYRPFLALVQMAAALGRLEEGATVGGHATQSKNQGLPHLERTLRQLEANIKAQPEQTPELAALMADVHALRETIQQAKDQLGAQSSHLGITRRGGETHVDLNPRRVLREPAQESSTQPGRGAALAPGAGLFGAVDDEFDAELIEADIHEELDTGTIDDEFDAELISAAKKDGGA